MIRLEEIVNAFKTKIYATVASVALASLIACGALVPYALASEASTKVNAALSNTQVNITAPLKVDITVKPDGTFLAPDSTTLQIINNSPYNAHVKGIVVNASNNFKIVEQTEFDASTAKEALWMSISPNGSAPIQISTLRKDPILTTPGIWNLAPAGEIQSKINLGFSGAIKNDTLLLADTPTELYTLTWTFAAGSAK